MLIIWNRHTLCGFCEDLQDLQEGGFGFCFWYIILSYTRPNQFGLKIQRHIGKNIKVEDGREVEVQINYPNCFEKYTSFYVCMDKLDLKC